jgi:hypothetical protein
MAEETQLLLNFQTEADRQEALDAICYTHGYPLSVRQGEEVIPNPQTKEQFAKEKIAQWIKGSIITWRVHNATVQANQEAKDSVSNFTIN